MPALKSKLLVQDAVTPLSEPEAVDLVKTVFASATERDIYTVGSFLHLLESNIFHIELLCSFNYVGSLKVLQVSLRVLLDYTDFHIGSLHCSSTSKLIAHIAVDLDLYFVGHLDDY